MRAGTEVVMSAMAVSKSPEYPVRFELDYQEQVSRGLILVRWLLVIPQLLVVNVLSNLAAVLAFLAFWVILFKSRYPESIFRLVVGATRWQYNVCAYALFRDGPYPPFSFDAGAYPHLRYDVSRQERYNRWLPLVKWLIVVPHYVALGFLVFVGVFVWLFAVVAVVVTGRFPRGAFYYLVGVGRWGARVTAYILLQVDAYPPFSMR
ncbi:MAG: DUF4389 domain-containing protein [Dehalococcoidia bacterium]|nr:DUF4389 domain-containing protein [Dehalococcoidia bacterium]